MQHEQRMHTDAVQVKRLRRAFVRISGGLALACLLPFRAAAQVPGDLDATFGTGGVVITNLGGLENAKALAIQPDGKIVVAGEGNTVANRKFLLARYLPDGTMDPAFGSGGVVISDFGGFEYFSAVVVQTDGKIVGGGRFNSDFALVRYLANGSLDLAFGTGGLVRTDLGSIEEIAALILQPDGKLVAAGWTQRSTFDFALVRYNADGTPDASFGAGTGRVISDWGGAELAFALALQLDGKLVAAGLSERVFIDASGVRRVNRDFAVARYDADGALDATFGTGGLVTTEFTAGALELAEAVFVQPDGKIIAAGYRLLSNDNDFAIARYNMDGTLDATFGNGGLVTTDILGGSDEVARGIVLQRDSKIVVAGSTGRLFEPPNFALVRYMPDGSLDTGFGQGGHVTTDLGGGTSDEVNGAALQQDGKVVLAGLLNNTQGGFDVALARYLMGEDEEPPRLFVSATPDVLWPPNNKFWPVSFTVSTQAGPPVSGCFISAVHSNEGRLFPGEIDWQVNGPLTVNLRAARTGSGQGRLYTITVTCTTRSRSLVTGSAAVLVPHDRSK
jgi:uncharacterized delta-60 repeat protein